jgi:Putative MetA-pathway of phenol degradation
MRCSNLSLLASVLLAVCVPICHAQSSSPDSVLSPAATPDPISTDRPSVCTGPELVPVHALQFENGTAWTRAPAGSPPRNAADFTQTEVRFGLSRRVELEAFVPDMHLPGAMPGVRFNDFAFGTKLMLIAKDRPWPLAVVATLSLPTGSSELTSGGVDPTVLLGVEHALPHNLQLAGSANLTSLSASGQPRSAQSQLAFDLGWCATEKACLYAEEAPFLGSAQNSSGFTSDAGITLRLAPRVQLDSRVGATVQSGDRTYFLTLGYSFRHDFR